MNILQIQALIYNLIVYLIMISPILFISFRKKIYQTKSLFISNLIISFIIEIILSVFLYKFSHKIFSLFTNTNGIINYAVYASKILFISSSLYGIKLLTPIYLSFSNKKKSAILFLSKIAVNLILIFIGYKLFNTKGILFSIPICDLIYYIIYTILIVFN